MKVKVEDFLEGEGFTEILEEILDTSRWHTLVRTVARHDESGKIYEWVHRNAATEYQEHDWSWNDEIELDEVEAVEVKTIQYRKVKK